MRGLHRNVYLLAASIALAMSCNTLIIATAALVGHELATDKSLATLPLALQLVATMCTSIPAALLMQRIGRKRAFLAATLFGMAGGGFAALAILQQSFWLFTAATCSVGIFNGFTNYFRFTAADSVALPDKGRAVSLVMAGGVLAAVIGPNLARLSREWLSGAEFAGGYLVSMALYVLILLALTFLRLDETRPAGGQAGNSGRPLPEILLQPRFLVALVCGMFGYAVMTFVMTATPLSMQGHAYHFDDTSTVIQWHVVAMFAPSFFTGNLIARFGAGPVMASGALLGLGSIAANLGGIAFMNYLAGLVLLGLSWNFLFVGATTLLTGTYTAAEKNKAQALNDFSVFTLVALASLSAGSLQSRFGWEAVNLAAVPLLLAALGSALWLARCDKSNKPGSI